MEAHKMKITIIKYIALVIYFLSTSLNAQNIPENAWASGTTWYCNDGYKKKENQCIKFIVPANAWVSGSSWYCNEGYSKK